MTHKRTHYEFVIIGAGAAGSWMFNRLTPRGKTLLVEKQADTRGKQTHQAKIICKHCFPWLSDIPWKNSTIFPRNHLTSQYRSRDQHAVVDGEEFDTNLGKIVNLSEWITWNLNQGETKGGTIQWNTEIQSQTQQEDKVILKTTEGTKIQAKLVILATGARRGDLNAEFGLPPPEIRHAISMTFFGYQ